MSEPGTAPWRRAEASRLIEFGRAAALPDGGFGWLGANGEIDVTQPCPLYVNSRMTYVFALAHLAGVAGADALAASGHVHMVGQARSLPLLSGPAAPVAPAEPDRGHRASQVRPAGIVTRLAAVLIGGPPATGKSTLATALAPELGAALLDLDVATGPLTRVVSDLIGVRDLDDPVLAGLTRAARYDTLLGLADANLRAGRPVVLVAPFSAERARPSAWAAIVRRLGGEPTMVWLHLPPDELVRRLTQRALARDENKIRDPASFLTGLDLEPPVVPHLALDASPEMSVVLASVFACPGTGCSPRAAGGRPSRPGLRRRDPGGGPGPQRPGHRPAQARIPRFAGRLPAAC